MSSPTVITLGCRLNAYEAEVVRERASAAGLVDAAIVNTCAVTAEAVRQATQAIRKIRREQPRTKVIVTGCAAQIEPRRFAELPEVDYVVGNSEKLRFGTYVDIASQKAERVRVENIASAANAPDGIVTAMASRARAYVEVQNGCDHRCTFCVIPLGRGPSRSIAPDSVVSHVRRLVEAGCREIVLTGVDVTSYRGDAPDELTLGRLVRRILREVPELARLRLSSVDQVEVDVDLMAAMAEEPRLMPHLHLSLQAGDDLILKRMKRRHSRQQAISFCEKMRDLRPDVVFGADLIAGFPTETPAQFEQTVSLVAACGLTFLHVFPYSPRPGTPAARMPQVPRPVVKERAARLRAAGAAALSGWLDGQIGRSTPVFIERGNSGRTPQFAEAILGAVKSTTAGQTIEARVTGHDGRRLVAEALQ